MALLKQILMAWKDEVEKKPPEMNAEEAYKTLGLATGSGGHDEAKVVYLAQKCHMFYDCDSTNYTNIASTNTSYTLVTL